MAPRATAHFVDGNFADTANAADVGNTFVHPILAQVIRWIDVVDEDARLVILKMTSNPRGLDSANDAHGVARVYPLSKNVPGNRAINRARIQKGKPESPRKLVRDTALPGSGRAINRNDAIKIFPHVRN